VTPDAVVDTRDFLRPQFNGGRLTLVVEQAAGGVLQPFEVEFPHECCGGHQTTGGTPSASGQDDGGT
jgi:hypothetical protein